MSIQQLKGTIMRKTDSVKHALTNILQSELETLKVEIEVSLKSSYISESLNQHRFLYLRCLAHPTRLQLISIALKMYRRFLSTIKHKDTAHLPLFGTKITIWKGNVEVIKCIERFWNGFYSPRLIFRGFVWGLIGNIRA